MAVVSTSFKQFGKRMVFRARQVEKLPAAYMRELTIGIGKSLISHTPVLTGQARGNWLASIGAPRRDMLLGGTASAGAAYNQSIAPILPLIGPDDSVYINNNLWYIEHLNTRPQSRGFVEMAVAEGRATGRAVYFVKHRLK